MDNYSELLALLELLAMLVTAPRTGVLLALLAIAAATDFRTFRIPNWLTGGGIVFALAYNSIVPPLPHATWMFAPAGMLLGFALTVPMYALRAMGAGDVKLLAMVGAFLGPVDVLYALLFSFATAGVAAIAFAAGRGVAGRMLSNARAILSSLAWSALAGARPAFGIAPGASVGRLALGISIAFGTSAFVVARHFNLV